MTDKIKIKVSLFVANILENDALRFGFLKNGNSNKNALLNKLIPRLRPFRIRVFHPLRYGTKLPLSLPPRPRPNTR